jgi:hypothetical protein
MGETHTDTHTHTHTHSAGRDLWSTPLRLAQNFIEVDWGIQKLTRGGGWWWSQKPMFIFPNKLSRLKIGSSCISAAWLSLKRRISVCYNVSESAVYERAEYQYYQFIPHLIMRWHFLLAHECDLFYFQTSVATDEVQRGTRGTWTLEQLFAFILSCISQK